MILRWLKRRRATSTRVAVDAEALMHQFGDAAYDEARGRAIDALSRWPVDLHWSLVRREIGCRIGRGHVDTATRYLEP